MELGACRRGAYLGGVGGAGGRVSGVCAAVTHQMVIEHQLDTIRTLNLRGRGKHKQEEWTSIDATRRAYAKGFGPPPPIEMRGG